MRLNPLLFVFQARNVTTGELAAIKVIKLEPGKILTSHPFFTSLALNWKFGSYVWFFVLHRIFSQSS